MSGKGPFLGALHDWHVEKWWHEEQYRDFLRDIPLEVVDSSVARVAQVFNSKWMAKRDPHPAWMFLGARGTLPLECLVELGTDLLAAEGALRLPTVVGDLRAASHFRSASIELKLAAIFCRLGYEVEFRPPLPNGKEADLCVTDKNSHVFFEVKTLSQSDVELSTSELSMAILMAVGEFLRNQELPETRALGYEIRLSDGVSDLMGAGQEPDRATIHGLTSGVIAELAAHFGRNELAFVYEVAGLVQVRIGPNLRSSLSGPKINRVADVKRAVMKFLRRAGEQLHRDHPGIVVCHTGSVLDSAVTRVCIEPLLGVQASARHVSAAVFLPVYTSRPERVPFFPPFAVFNPSATFQARDLDVYKTLSHEFNLDK
jgi:hypothetical protein